MGGKNRAMQRPESSVGVEGLVDNGMLAWTGPALLILEEVSSRVKTFTCHSSLAPGSPTFLMLSGAGGHS